MPASSSSFSPKRKSVETSPRLFLVAVGVGVVIALALHAQTNNNANLNNIIFNNVRDLTFGNNNCDKNTSSVPLLHEKIRKQQQEINRLNNLLQKNVALQTPLAGTIPDDINVPLPFKVAIYMTTHLSPKHVQFLERCWPAAVQHLRLLQQADLIVYTSENNTTSDSLYYNLGFRNVTIRRYQVYAYQEGATVAMVDPFRPQNKHWFHGYDWIIRLNPDVLIRRDQWLIQTLQDPNVDGIFTHWKNNHGQDVLHSDFYAFRPHVANGQALIQEYEKQKQHLQNELVHNRSGFEAIHAETHLAAGFPRTTVKIVWLPNSKRRKWAARTEGVGCDVTHTHEIIQFCPNYFNSSNGIWY